MNKSDLLSGVSRAMMSEVSQDIHEERQTQFNVHAEDVPPNIRNTAYEMAGSFYESNRRTPKFRRAAKLMLEQRGISGVVSAETFAVIFWPQYVDMAIQCLTECLTWPGIPMHEKELISDEIIAFNKAMDARAKSVVRTKKFFEHLN